MLCFDFILFFQFIFSLIFDIQRSPSSVPAGLTDVSLHLQGVVMLYFTSCFFSEVTRPSPSTPSSTNPVPWLPINNPAERLPSKMDDHGPL